MDLLGRLIRRHLVLVTVLAVAGATGCAAGGGASSGDPPSSAAAPGAVPAQVAERVGSVVPEPPQGLRLPNGRQVGIRTVGTTRNGVLDVPDDIDVAGWWQGGSRLGDPFGSTLVAAHVDSTTQGLGPFVSLLTLQPGDRVTVWSESLQQTFAVKARRLRPQGTLGPGSWLHSPEGPRRLTLVTCAGPYDPDRGGYQNLAVVVAAPLGGPVERS